MHDRTALGAANVTDDELARIAADSLRLDPSRTRLLDSVASEFPYDLPSITTAGRREVESLAQRVLRIAAPSVSPQARAELYEDTGACEGSLGALKMLERCAKHLHTPLAST